MEHNVKWLVNKKVVYFEPPWNDFIVCDHNHFFSSEVLKDDEVEGDKESVKNLFTSAKGKNMFTKL